MSFSRTAGSQAGWALIAGGVNAARVEAHQLHQYVSKILDLIQNSPEREHLYQVAGDIIVDFPRRVEKIEEQLDELGYALSVMGKDHLKDRLSLSRRNRVDQTVEGAPTFKGPMFRQTAKTVAKRHLARRVARRYLGES